MHNARIRILAFLWLCLPWLAMAQPLPPVTRSVLTTNIPAFGTAGQALFRTTVLPYLNWSNITAIAGGDTVLSNYVVSLSNLLYQSDNIVSNWVNAVSNRVDASDTIVSNWVNTVSNYTWASDNVVSNYAWGTANNVSNWVNSVSNLTWNGDNIVSNWVNSVSNLISSGGSGAYIPTLNGLGTNTTFRQSAAGSVPVTVVPLIGSTTNRVEVQDTNGNPKFVVNSEGRVGVGTNLPQALLHICGTNGPSQYILQVDNPMIANHTNAFTIGTNDVAAFLGTINAGVALNVANGLNAGGGISSTGNVSILGSSTLNIGSSTVDHFTGGIIGLYRQSTNFFGLIFGTNSTSGTNMPALRTFGTGYSNTPIPTIRVVSQGGAGPVNLEVSGSLAVGTNIVQKGNVAWPHLMVVGDNGSDVSQIGTTNKLNSRWDTNGNAYTTGTFAPTNGIINQVSNSFIGNLVITTNNPQLYCVNGTNQLITLPDTTKIQVGQIYRFSSTNGYASVVITNATGTQPIRDSISLDYKVSGVFSVAFYTDGEAWWLASKAKTIWPNASWSTTTNVPMAVAGSNYITYDQLETSNAQGITLTNGYQIYIRDPGQYMLTYSVVTQVGHNNDTNRVWLQQSGKNVLRSRTDVKLTSTAEQVVMTVNYIVPVVTNLTWFALCVRSTDTGGQLVTGAAADATQPSMPSAIVTVNKISDSFP